jgi:hypothetical protein
VKKIEFDLNDPEMEADYLRWWRYAHSLGMTVEEFVRRAANLALIDLEAKSNIYPIKPRPEESGGSLS